MRNSVFYKGVRRKALDVRYRTRRAIGRWRMSMAGGYRVNGQLKRLLAANEGNDAIRACVAAGQPMMATRYGSFELAATVAGLGGNQDAMDAAIQGLHSNAGFFPCDSSLLGRFAELYVDSTRSADVFGAWLFRHGSWSEEKEIYSSYCPEAELVDIRSFDAFCFEQPWTSALSGKKVLVVHPFIDSIRSQYDKRGLLFKNPQMLPEFADLQVVRAVQSIAGTSVPYDSWFDALGAMCDEIDATEYDVAIIGAGAYGLPLASHVKKRGKQAIHSGGVTQLYFGIFGDRWKDWYPDLPNEHWVRPSSQETPGGFKKVEGGCYW